MEPDSYCRAYYGYTVKGVTVGESPRWMQQRLTECGLRPINSIVDISNYVMLETGQPNHIFDRTRIEKERIIVRQAGKEEKFVTLDEIPRTLTADDTVIADGSNPWLSPGLWGDSTPGVTDGTDRAFRRGGQFLSMPGFGTVRPGSVFVPTPPCVTRRASILCSLNR